jgi:hypothetical protein
MERSSSVRYLSWERRMNADASVWQNKKMEMKKHGN